MIKSLVNGKILITGNLKDLIENLIYMGDTKSYKTGKCIKQGQIVNVGVNGPDSVIYNKNLQIRFIK